MILVSVILIVLASLVAIANIYGLIHASWRGRQNGSGGYSNIHFVSLTFCTISWFLSNGQIGLWVILPVIIDPANWLLLALPFFLIFRSDRDTGAHENQHRVDAARPPWAGYEVPRSSQEMLRQSERNRLDSFEESIRAHPAKIQSFLIKATRLLPDLPSQAVHAVDVAEQYHQNLADAAALTAERVKCWQLSGRPESEIGADAAALRAAICALYPTLDAPFETVRFFFEMSSRCNGPVSEQLDLLRDHLHSPTIDLNASDLLCELFEGHKVPCTTQNSWVAPNGELPAIRTVWTEHEQDCTGRLDVETVLSDKRAIVESFAGLGDSSEARQTDAFQNFLASSYHVLLAALWGVLDADQVDVSTWMIGDKEYQVYSGGFCTRASAELNMDIPGNYFNLLEDAIRNSEPTLDFHWYRTYICNLSETQRVYEALADNKAWKAGVDMLKKTAWVDSPEFYSVRNFVILGRKDR